MKGLCITSRGIEDAAAKEIKELINSSCNIGDGYVSFDFENFEELCLLCYKSQSIDRALHLIGSFDFYDNFLKELEKFLEKTNFDAWIKNHKTFKVDCIRLGSHDFKSIDVEAKASEFILKKYKLKVGIKNHEIIFLVYIVDNKCYFGVDFAGFELNKRGYKIFLHSGSLRGTIAYALVRESGFEKDEVMLDPFSRDGVVPIEAAFFAAGFPHNYYKKDRFAFLKLKLGIDFDKFFKNADEKIKKSEAEIYSYDHLFKFVDYSRKNAKIGGVEKFINFSRTELEWLDIKFKEASVDRIITNLPSSKGADLEKIYNEFFYQSAYILKKTGTIALISKNVDLLKKHAEKHDFVVAKEKEVWSGEQLLKMAVLKIKKKSI